MVISELAANWNGMHNEEGLYLRTVHSSASVPLVARLVLSRRGRPLRYTAERAGAVLRLHDGGDKVEFCFSGPGQLLVRGTEGVEVTADFLSGAGPYDYVYHFERGGRSFDMANCYKNNCRYLMSADRGVCRTDQVWQESTALHSRLTFSGDGGFAFALREISTEWDGRWEETDFDACAAAMNRSLRAFQRRLPSCPEAWRETAEEAGYLLWSSYVVRQGFLPREAMLMSKNWMKSVWSWDHCFNAIALSYHAPEEAWDQYMIMFDMQDATGVLPDSINDVHVVWNYCKPPVHGWALRWMMKNMELTLHQAEEAYGRLEKWTRWWQDFRDYDGDGLCEYSHGNDSGWDNATVFSVLPPVASPELQALLIIQMDVLASLAVRLGKEAEASAWKGKSDRLLENMVRQLTRDGLPVAVRSGSHEIIPNESLLPYICIVLGEKLPEGIRERMLRVLTGDTFRTRWGYATESPESRCYRSDGYWRGPVWAPSTMLLMDGLSRCGQGDLVRETVRCFADMVKASGFAENFDAITGEGLRDRSYTWTASVFLAMAHEYLCPADGGNGKEKDNGSVQ